MEHTWAGAGNWNWQLGWNRIGHYAGQLAAGRIVGGRVRLDRIGMRHWQPFGVGRFFRSQAGGTEKKGPGGRFIKIGREKDEAYWNNTAGNAAVGAKKVPGR